MGLRKSCRFAVVAICPLAGPWAAAIVAQSLDTQAAMHARVVSLYDFSPGTTTDEVRASKSKEMDSFWSEVTRNKDAELPLLRKELEVTDDPRFFFMDGSNLLLSLSQTPDDLHLAAQSLARSNIKDVETHAYLFEIHGLAMKGVNVTPAALHMLDDPTFQVFLPEHGAYKLDQSACMLVALLPLPTDTWFPDVVERMRTEREATAMKSLLLLLFYAQTDDADRLIRSRATATDSAKDVKEFANTILKHERELGPGKQPSKATETKLREERRKRMFAVSDEAMDDLEDLTAKIARARTPAAIAP